MKRLIIGVLLITCVAFAQDTAVTTPEAVQTQTTEEPKQPNIMEEKPKQELTITPAQALEFLARAAAEYRGTLDEHMVLRQSVITLAKTLGLDKPEEPGK